VWASASANMSMYLMLRERARAFRADPRVQEALKASGLLSLAQPTLAPGETIDDLTFSPADADRLADRGYAYVQLAQLGIEHLMGAR